MKKALILLVATLVLATTTQAAEEYKNGLAAHYYKDATNWNGMWPEGSSTPLIDPKLCTFTEYKYSRMEPLINHQFIREGWFSIRWVGYLEVPPDAKEGATFNFEVFADDGCRLKIDDEILVDSWIACAENNPNAHRTATKKLAAGRHRIVIEYFEGISLLHNDKDPMRLYWESVDCKIPKQIIPAARFSYTDEDLANPDKAEIIPAIAEKEQTAETVFKDAGISEGAKEFALALRLYRQILRTWPDSPQAVEAKEKILAIEADPRIKK